AWAAESHRRAAAASDGPFFDEIVPIEVPQRRGSPVTVDRDEGMRPDSTPESLATLKASFSADGTITAGNASQI
nr:acetyl-CoA C-acyltransferase [Desulfuromonadales bacterium]